MDTVAASPAPPTLTRLLAQGRILRALAGGACLHGTLEDLSQRLEVSPEACRLALRDLVAGGQIFVAAGRVGALIVGHERRVRESGPPGMPERRRPSARWEDPDLPPAS